MEYAKFLRTPILKNICEWLLLILLRHANINIKENFITMNENGSNINMLNFIVFQI